MGPLPKKSLMRLQMTHIIRYAAFYRHHGEDMIYNKIFIPDSPPTEFINGLPHRKLGETNERVSLIGVGGFHIGMPEDEREGIRIVRTAIDNGINFMDNCWDYNDGMSEIRMGKALKDGYRDNAFLMTKIDGRDRKTASIQIEESLRRLQTDCIDLLQLHEVIRMEDPDLAFGKNGAMAAMMAAKEQGKIRYIGFTGHKDPLVHLRMLDVAEQNGFRFDAVQMPLNVMDAHFRSFQNQVLPRLFKENIGILGMKSMGAGLIIRSKLVQPIECLHYAMTLPASTVITGMENLGLLEQALEAARTFKPLTQEQISDLLNRTAEAAQEGKYELFKTGTIFDATARNLHWLYAD